MDDWEAPPVIRAGIVSIRLSSTLMHCCYIRWCADGGNIALLVRSSWSSNLRYRKKGGGGGLGLYKLVSIGNELEDTATSDEVNLLDLV